MITEERGLTMLANANPVPRLDSIDVEVEATLYLATLEQRSSEVTQLDTKKSDLKDGKRSVVPWLVAASAVVILAVALILVNQGTEETPPVTQPTATTLVDTAPTTSPTTTQNLSTALDLMATIFVPGEESLSDFPTVDETVLQTFAWLSAGGIAVNSEIIESRCTPNGTIIVCKVTSKDDISKAIDEGDYYIDTFKLSFEESGQKIASVDWEVFQTGKLAAFSEWVFFEGGLHGTGGVCATQTEPEECSLAHLALTQEYNDTQGS